MKRSALLMTMLLGLVCQVAFSQGNTGTGNTGNNDGNTSNTTATNNKDTGGADQATMDFISNAATANLKEIAAGKLAAKKGQDPSVKAYGGKMIDHHTMATKEMAQIVKSKNIKPGKPPVEMAAPDSALMNAKGTEFDKMYVMAMIADHKKAIALFQTASTQLSDQDLKAFAAKTLPMLQQHLAEIQGIASKMNISTE